MSVTESSTMTRLLPAVYVTWAALAIGLAITAGLTPENVTRLLVLAFLAGQIALRSLLLRALTGLSPKARFITMGILLAAVVEGLHMVSAPVFPSLRIDGTASAAQGIINYSIDLAFTLPAYLVIFSVMWAFISRFHFTLWRYILIMGLGQTLGDGGLFFFLAAPPMLLFLPYPMTNYHAINVLPFLAVRERLGEERAASKRIYLAVPALVGTYLVCGGAIKLVGRLLGLASD